MKVEIEYLDCGTWEVTGPDGEVLFWIKGKIQEKS